MSDLRELYQEVILDHSKRPRNFRKLEAANRRAKGHNPLCGDRVELYLEVENGSIRDVAFQGAGCAISTASASVLTETIKGKTVAEVEQLFDTFHDLVTGKPAGGAAGPELGKLAVFSGVVEFPARVKCATMVWHTLRAALEQSEETVSTE
jgi:nitrogen fixation NifU-like protein